MTTRLHRMARLLAACAVTLGTVGVSAEQTSVTAPALKAAFVYNFAKFTEWPADPASGTPLRICVVGDEAVADALDSTIRGRAVETRPVVVTRSTTQRGRDCNVLYVTGLTPAGLRQVLDHLRHAPVLTVSDEDRFAEAGGHIGLFVEQGRMRFAVNVDAAQRAHIRISSRLLSLARLVKDGDNSGSPLIRVP